MITVIIASILVILSLILYNSRKSKYSHLASPGLCLPIIGHAYRQSGRWVNLLPSDNVLLFNVDFNTNLYFRFLGNSQNTIFSKKWLKLSF